MIKKKKIKKIKKTSSQKNIKFAQIKKKRKNFHF